MAVGRRPVRKSTTLDPYLKLVLKMGQPWPLLVLLLAFSQFHDSSCIKMYKPKKQSVAVFLSGIGRSTRQWWPPNIRLSVNNLWRNRHRTSRLSRTMIALTLRCSHYTLLSLSLSLSLSLTIGRLENALMTVSRSIISTPIVAQSIPPPKIGTVILTRSR